MNTRITSCLLAAALLLPAVTTFAVTEVKVPDERPTFTIVFVENLRAQYSSSDLPSPKKNRALV